LTLPINSKIYSSRYEAHRTSKRNPTGICQHIAYPATSVYKRLSELDKDAELNPVDRVFQKLMRLGKTHRNHKHSKCNHVV
jgi:hypothetical protein